MADTNNILLINMPFGQLGVPSIGLSLLKSRLKQFGIESQIRYTTFKFAELIGVETYSMIANGAPANHDLLGEWIFSCEVFNNIDTTDRFINMIIRGGEKSHQKADHQLKWITPEFIDRILLARDKSKKFIQICVDEILEYSPIIVGFTSVFSATIVIISGCKSTKESMPQHICGFWWCELRRSYGARVSSSI